MNRGRGDRPAFPGLRVATGGGDLIEDIHRQQRRRLLKRAGQLVALAIALLLVGVAIKIVKDRRDRAKALEEAYALFVRGAQSEAQGAPMAVEQAIAVLEESLAEEAAHHPPTQVALALARAHLWLELDIGEDETRAAVEAIEGTVPGTALARAMVAFGDDDVDAAQAALDEDRALDGEDEEPVDPFVLSQRAWLQGWLAVAHGAEDAEGLGAAAQALREQLEQTPEQVALRRVLALVLLVADDREQALAELELAREHGRYYMALSADDALYNAYLRQELEGVASVADQLLEDDMPGLGPHDRAHAQLARAVVHVQSGENEDGLAMLDRAWTGLAPWDRLSRRLAIQSALEAGDASRIDAWVKQTPLPEPEGDIYRAWAVLVEGDVMKALTELAELPQADPWVGYLQALALVEQGRHAEAAPWIDRTEKTLPRRHEIEVARARVELHLGDKKVALRKLEALAKEEARAPRAWTGLGEAYLLQDEPDLREAKRALQRAIEREPMPAEAMLQLARVWDKRRGKDPEAERKALEMFGKAAEANPHLPRYREQQALYLDEIGFSEQALLAMRDVVDAPGVGWEVPLRLVRLETDLGSDDFDPEPLLEEATKRGAPPDAVFRQRARIEVDSGDAARISKAQADLAKRLEQAPKDVEARVLYAQTYLKQYDRKEAESVLRRGVSLVDDDGKDGRLLLAWAELEFRTGKGRKAAPRARRAWVHMLEEDRPPGELLEAAELATRLWLRINRDRPALSIAKQLTDELAYHGDAWTIRAGTELQAGDADDARKSVERAIELDGDNPRAYEILGNVHMRYGEKREAEQAYAKSRALAKAAADRIAGKGDGADEGGKDDEKGADEDEGGKDGKTGDGADEEEGKDGDEGDGAEGKDGDAKQEGGAEPDPP